MSDKTLTNITKQTYRIAAAEHGANETVTNAAAELGAAFMKLILALQEQNPNLSTDAGFAVGNKHGAAFVNQTMNLIEDGLAV